MVAIFFCSTGRCATQALTTYFADNLGEKAVVEHEPLGPRLNPRLALRHPDLAALRLSLPEVDQYFRRIAGILASDRHYVSPGWPAYAWFPHLKELLGDQFRWVHLVRNPLYVAGSLITHHFYDPEKLPHYSALACLQPTDPGVAYPEFAGEWTKFSIYEKCLYHWLEINRYACDLSAMPGLAPVRVLRYEDLFSKSSNSFKMLYGQLGFGIPSADDLKPVDRFKRLTLQRPSLSSKRLWQEVDALAKTLGYRARELSRTRVHYVWWRYSSPWREATGTGLKVVWRLGRSLMPRATRRT